jgi:uncharacterized membrane protein
MQVKKDVKEKLTIQSTGSSGGEGPRTHIQGMPQFTIWLRNLLICCEVLANSGVASILILLSAYRLSQRPESSKTSDCYPWGGDLLIVGIIANYAAVAADTFSSELGILSESRPRLITSLSLRKVPKGTNGGVTIWGLVAGFLGSLIIVATAMSFIPFCGLPMYPLLGGEKHTVERGLAGSISWNVEQLIYFGGGMVIWGGLGSVLDSFLGGWLQQSVVDTRSGRVVEGVGGPNSFHFEKRAEVKAKLYGSEGKDAIPKTAGSPDLSKGRRVEGVLDEKMGWTNRYDPSVNARKPNFGDGEPSRTVVSGLRILDNNEVNFLMALTMSLGAIAIAGWAWDVPFRSIFQT